MTKEELQKLHTNQRLLLEELISRGVQVTPVVTELELVEARYGLHRELIIDRDSSIGSYAASLITSDKSLTKMLLKQNGISTPRGAHFFPEQRELAVQFAFEIGWPVVVKPVSGSHGRGCFMGISSIEELERAIDEHLLQFGRNLAFLIEQEITGGEYRIFITEKGRYAVLHRTPASVVGDGISNVQELAMQESLRRMNPRTNCLCPIIIDKSVEHHLSKAQMSLDTIPKKGEIISLRATSNIAQGGVCEDVTELVHNGYIQIALEILEIIPGLPYAGVDIVTETINRDPKSTGYAVLEVNSNPGIHMHMRPASGRSQNVAAYIADLIFPETNRNAY